MTNQFTRKATQSQSTGGEGGASQDQWNEWNQHQFDAFSAKVKELPNGKLRKEKTLIGKANLIVDLGFPYAKDSEWDTKCALPDGDEEYSKEELVWKKEKPTHDFVWVKEWNANADNGRGGKGAMTMARKQTSPSYPAQEYGCCVDFPSIMVDYSKHPYSDATEPQLRPYRISLNGVFNREVQRPIVFDGSFKPVSDKNVLYKICAAGGKEKELVEGQFDIATVAETVCNFQVRLDLSEGDKIFLNDSVSKPSQIDDIEMPDESIYSAEDQIAKVMNKEGLVPFTGILLDGMDYTDEMLEMVYGDKFGFIARAETSAKFEISGISKKTNEPYSFEKGLDYADTEFAKAFEAYKAKRDSNAPSKPQNSDKPSPKQTPVEEKKTPESKATEPVMDFDDDVPFAPMWLPYGKASILAM